MAKNVKDSDEDHFSNNSEKTSEINNSLANGESITEDENMAIASPFNQQVSTPKSIIIQSLVQWLCENGDGLRAQVKYKEICDILYERKLIDKSYQMPEFENLRTQVQNGIGRIFTNTEAQAALVPLWKADAVIDSHFKKSFEELGYIAKGGFSKVFRVKHKLDGTEYAIKKILIKASSIQAIQEHLREAKTFATLNHSNVVQYKGAWMEMGATASDFESASSEVSFEDEPSSEESAASKSDNIEKELDNALKTQSSSDFVIFQNSRHNSLHSRKEKRRVKRNSASEGGNAICTIEDIRRLQVKHEPKWATLFIQMSLCHLTLKQWIDNRNNAEASNPNAVVPVNNSNRFANVKEILRQILLGLEYIHCKGIIHHDIKPSNIFMTWEANSLLVQIGDFGLACPFQNKHSTGRGTNLYAAPEQLAGKCDPKSDMYSLGIVALELTETFLTDMERNVKIVNLRNGKIPEFTLKQQPKLAEIISQLVVCPASKRPDAATLLGHPDLQKSSDHALREAAVIIAEQKNTIAKKDLEISRLQEEISKLKAETPGALT